MEVDKLMPSFGTKSRFELDSCHDDIQDVCNIAILHRDFSVTEGKRSEDQQKNNMASGVSKTLNSKHVYPLGEPSNAVDIQPYPFRGWPSEEGISETEKLLRLKDFNTLASYIIGVGHGMGINLISGMDWDGDWDFTDQSFHDLPHIQRDI